MLIVVATMDVDSTLARTETWKKLCHGTPVFGIVDNSERNRGLVRSYQHGYKTFWLTPPECDNSIIGYIHDDVEIGEEGWDRRVIKEFNNPTIGLVGFGGALRHGTDDIYKTRYCLQQLARDGYLSSTDDAEVHGQRFTGECDVAVLDGFALIVRREVLDRAWHYMDRHQGIVPIQGWPVDRLTFHCYDYWLCCMAHRLGYRIRLVGIKCHHLGGQTSTTPAYQDWLAARGTNDVEDHERSHRFIYREFSDVLPWRCG